MIALHVHERGEAGGEPVIWLHGFLGTGADFDAVADDLGAGFHHLAPDLPGHGATRATRLSDHAMEAAGAAVLDLVAQRRLRQPHLVGYSMGGRLALHLAARARHAFAHVVAVSATPGLDDPAEAAARRAADRRLAVRLMTEPLPAFLDDWYAQPLFSGLAGAGMQVGAMQARRLTQRPDGLARSLRAMGTGSMAPLWAALPHLPAPVDAIVGQTDAKFCAIAARMAATGPVRVHSIAGSGHAPHLEQPRAFVQTLQRVLLSNRP